jgi:integrase
VSFGGGGSRGEQCGHAGGQERPPGSAGCSGGLGAVRGGRMIARSLFICLEEELMSEELLDRLGRWRSPAATWAFHVGRPPRNRGLRYPADPPAVEEIVAVMRAGGPGAHGDRLRAIIVVLCRAGLRVGEALALAETDLDPARGAVVVRRGRGGKRREVGLDAWGWRALDLWLEYRCQLPVGPLLCVLHGPSRGRPWSPAAVRRVELRRAGARPGMRRRLAPHH